MTSKTQQNANKKNALNSTGPKTSKGKSKSSRNAQTHGLTKPPEVHTVLNWFRVILNDANKSLNSAHVNERFRAAFSLAEAEAHLQQVRDAETQFHINRLKEEAGLSPLRKISDAAAQMDFKEAGEFTSILEGLFRSLRSDGRKKLSLLNRYLSEAESARRKAFMAWLEVC